VSHPSDYKVWPPRSEKHLAADAEALRIALGVDHRLEFNPFDAIEWFQRQPAPKKGLLHVHFFRGSSDTPPARVKYDPLRLFVTEGIWESAKEYRDPFAIRVLAHELGHIVEHDQTAKAFSTEEAKRLTAWPKEERAEWQADTFADHILLPWKFIIAYGFNIFELCGLCNVERELAIRQIAALRGSRRYSGDPCSKCQNFTLARNGLDLTCDTCGTTMRKN
jgi:hypothetical protein